MYSSPKYSNIIMQGHMLPLTGITTKNPDKSKDEKSLLRRRNWNFIKTDFVSSWRNKNLMWQAFRIISSGKFNYFQSCSTIMKEKKISINENNSSIFRHLHFSFTENEYANEKFALVLKFFCVYINFQQIQIYSLVNCYANIKSRQIK